MVYDIVGGNLPVLICTLDVGESMLTLGNSMSWMTPNVLMESTVVGGIAKTAGKVFSGDSILQNSFTAHGGAALIAFSANMPGAILPFKISPDKDMIVQKNTFLASEKSVEQEVFYQKRFGSSFFSNEGFVMQRLKGNGMAFIEIGGYALEYTLADGQELLVDTGKLAAMDSTCTVDIKTAPGLKSQLFGNEGLFSTAVRGPGRIILQTMPGYAAARSMYPYLEVLMSSSNPAFSSQQTAWGGDKHKQTMGGRYTGSSDGESNNGVLHNISHRPFR